MKDTYAEKRRASDGNFYPFTVPFGACKNIHRDEKTFLEDPKK